jgi:thiol-disulfide isomerase/thioredoxin
MEGEGNKEKARPIIIEHLKSCDLNQFIKYKERETIYAGYRELDLEITGRVPKTKQMKLEEFRESLYDLLSEGISSEFATCFLNESFNVQVGLCEGEKFQGLEASDLEGKKVSIKHEAGKILMIDFWATWCGYCQEPMQENVDLMNKNQELKSKGLSIVGLSCDEDTGKWINHVHEKKWNTIPQYVKAGVREQVGIRGIPCIVIIDSSGLVIYFGHPGEIKLEETLKNLLELKEVVRSEANDLNSFWKVLDVQSKIDIVSECNFLLKDDGITNGQFCVSTKYELNDKFELSPVKILPIFYGQVSQFEYDALQTAAITLQTNYNFDGFDFNIRLVDIGAEEDF